VLIALSPFKRISEEKDVSQVIDFLTNCCDVQSLLLPLMVNIRVISVCEINLFFKEY
jgi:hypothetical protein